MLEQIRTEINNMLKNDYYYKAYSKEDTIKAILIDINNIFAKYSGPETKFIFDNEILDSFSLIYKLANKGIINLEHDDMEAKGIEVTY